MVRPFPKPVGKSAKGRRAPAGTRTIGSTRAGARTARAGRTAPQRAFVPEVSEPPGVRAGASPASQLPKVRLRRLSPEWVVVCRKCSGRLLTVEYSDLTDLSHLRKFRKHWGFSELSTVHCGVDHSLAGKPAR